MNMGTEVNHHSEVSARPSQMQMLFQRGLLKTLGINLYANIGKVLVEFIANSYDSDSRSVWISFPESQIRSAREAIKEKSRKSDISENILESLSGEKKIANFDQLLDILPDDITLTIEDDGHGMSWTDVQDNYLPLNRQRRMDEAGRETKLLSPKGRYVMGRKGVGKLAGFGAAETVILWSKKVGDSYATIITMSGNSMEPGVVASSIDIPVSYEENLPLALSGTKITLKQLKSDAFRSSLRSIVDTISGAFFAIRRADMEILVNDIAIEQNVPDYEYIVPEIITHSKILDGEMADESVDIDGVGIVPFRYYIGFRKRSDHLAAAKRGARIYCNNRLAAGPTLFSLGTGMHSFHSADYMECIVEANALDRGSVDLISTSRTQLQEGNAVFDSFEQHISELMRQAIVKHGAFRERQAEAAVDSDPKASIIKRSVSQLPRKTRTAAIRLLNTIAVQYGVGTEEFEELAPVILNSVNATEVLARLVSIGTKPETISSIMGQLQELSEIERQDVLKLYRGRRGGITKLQQLQNDGAEVWKKKGLEKELHKLLKENPWLIRPEYSNYITSDEAMTSVASRLASHIGVDSFSLTSQPNEDDNRRPDLVFLMSDTSGEGPFVVKVVELKSPSLPLNIDHYRQIEDYIAKIKRWCDAELKRTIAVQGFLIGEMPEANAHNEKELSLLDRFKDEGPSSSIRIIGLTQLITDARNIHVDAIRSIEAHLGEGEENGGGDSLQAAMAGELADSSV